VVQRSLVLGTALPHTSLGETPIASVKRGGGAWLVASVFANLAFLRLSLRTSLCDFRLRGHRHAKALWRRREGRSLKFYQKIIRLI